ncbi:DUF3575 domain-containing protein [Tenacibaculum discolor]|uniref:DUF3575 domain-containing protein n=1 Tax=Tenacibaculum TaxID=104267 RepID=UPI000F5AC66E|nr:DUF3575 domain-containing protein [Tenacibaculum discolor]
MKKLLLVIAMVAVGVTANAQKNVIKANPLSLAFGSFEIGYERVVSESSSVELAVAYSSLKVNTTGGQTDAKANGFGVEGKYKFFFGDETPRGWYAAPVVTYSNTSLDSNGEEGDFSFFGGGAVAGYQWVFGGGDSGFALDLSLGAQYVSVSTSGSISSTSIEGFLPKLGLSLGYAW